MASFVCNRLHNHLPWYVAFHIRASVAFRAPGPWRRARRGGRLRYSLPGQEADNEHEKGHQCAGR